MTINIPSIKSSACLLCPTIILGIFISGQIAQTPSESAANDAIEISINQNKPYYGFYSTDFPVNMDIIIKNNLAKPTNITVREQTSLLAPTRVNMNTISTDSILLPAKSRNELPYSLELPEGQWILYVVVSDQINNEMYSKVQPFLVHPITAVYQYWGIYLSTIGLIGLAVAAFALIIQYKNFAEVKRQRRPWISVKEGFVYGENNTVKIELKNYGNEPTKSIDCIFLDGRRERITNKEDITRNRSEVLKLGNLAPDQTYRKDFPLPVRGHAMLYILAPAQVYYGFYIKYSWLNSNKNGELMLVYMLHNRKFHNEIQDLS